MRAIPINGAAFVYSWLHCAKMAEQIWVLFAMKTHGGLGKIVLDGEILIPPWGGEKRRGERDLIQPLPNYFGHSSTLSDKNTQSAIYCITQNSLSRAN